MRPIVLIDRDGTINVERNYLSDPDQIELLPQAAEGLKLLRELGLPVVVVTNQSGIGRGFFDLETLEKIHHRLRKVLQEHGTSVDAFYFCPHKPDDNCQCRKPRPGMAEQAARNFDADLSKSFLIGDKVCDIELGRNIGATTVLVRTGYGTKAEYEMVIQPDYIAENLFEAAKFISNFI